MRLKQHHILTDEQVISIIIQEGDTKLFGILYERYQKKVYNKCLYIIKDNSDAEELVQEIFLKVYTSLSGFKQASSFSTWLYAITYRFCIEYLRGLKKSKFDRLGMDIDLPEDLEEVEVQEIEEMKAEKLYHIIDLLQPIDKTILLMKYKDELRLKEIQQVLNLSESSTKMRIKRAKAKVVKLYAQVYLSN